ncbi:MAG: hypothetical protein RIQ60_4196 [Pseudomonadota bacterium]|jgi:penicillin amidase
MQTLTESELSPSMSRQLLRRPYFVLLIVVALLLFATVVTALVWRQRMLPVTSGRLAVRGLPTSASASSPSAGKDDPASRLRIERDADGVPTIKAATLEQAMFGLGFVHAQDRLWQLETHKRIGSGRLAEAFGPAALDTDRFLRALAVRHAAEAQWIQTREHPEARAVLLAYAAGVNALVRDHLRARPPEFLLLGLQPEEWTPVDSLAWGIMMAWDLGGNWSTELLRLRLAMQMPVQRINELLPPYPGERPVPTADYAALVREWRVSPGLAERTAQLQSTAPESGIEGVGSNNWVIDGRHSVTGKPLLANDPHLKLTAPALWYYVRIEVPGLQLAGATMPGVPLVVLGQNQHIAWGFTNTNPDVQDLYLERLHPDDAGVYETPQGWQRFDQQVEVIKVRGAADVRMTVRSTRHGPVISDANLPVTQGLTGAPLAAAASAANQAGSGAGVAPGDAGRDTPQAPAAARAPHYVIALRWTALDPDASPVEAGLAFNRARTVAEFINASADYVAPMQNMVVADAEGAYGHIGFVAAGRVPVRKPTNDLHGLVPAPGWDARYDWEDFLEPTLTPRERDPQRGWIATANQRIHGPDYPHYLTSEWAPPYRARRIEQLLAARPRHDLASLAEIQGDIVSLGAQRLLPYFRRALSEHPLAGRLATVITRFDGVMAPGQPAPLIYHAWARHLTQLVFADELGPLWQSEFGERRSFRDALEGVMDRQDAWWCDNKQTREVETCNDLANEALNRALTELQARLGDNPQRWQWGTVHQARAEHRPFSKLASLAWLFELRVPVGGDGHTVNVSRVGLKADGSSDLLYLSEHGPSLRAVYDVGDPSKSRFIYSSGQSGNPLSPLYRRFLGRWVSNGSLPLWSPVGSGAVDTLTLVAAPAGAGESAVTTSP